MYAWYVQLIVVWTLKKTSRNVWDMSASSHRLTTCVEYCEAPGWQASTELWSSHNCSEDIGCSWTMKIGNITHNCCMTWDWRSKWIVLTEIIFFIIFVNFKPLCNVDTLSKVSSKQACRFLTLKSSLKHRIDFRTKF